MSYRFPLLRSLDPYHQRIGYLGSVSVVAYRGLDTREALRARLELLLYQKVYSDSPEYAQIIAGASPQRRTLLEKLRRERTVEDNPTSVLRPVGESSDWLFLSEAWLYQGCMPSTLGFVSAKQIDRLIDLANWTGVLARSFELSETGFILQRTIEAARERAGANKLFNVLNPLAAPELPLVYLRLLMANEILWPALVSELAERSESGQTLATRGEDSLLRVAVDRLLADLGPQKDISDAVELREINAFRDAIAGKPSTAENYLRPRLEILVDLDLVGRPNIGDQRKKSAFAWTVTPRTHRVAQEWAGLLKGDNKIPNYLDQEFFGSMSRLYETNARRVVDSRRVLLWFSRAFTRVGREIGFTPGRTMAVLACLMAWTSGEIIEVNQVFDAVYEAARTQWGEFLRYSGGSRMDREFMIKVEPEMAAALEVDLREKPEVN